MSTMFDPKKEEKILEFWRDNKIFEKSLEQRAKPSPTFLGKKKRGWVFFEGPPTANGLPHIGHFLTRIYKDVFGRYKTMRGFFVLRKAGWDTHGLPVEIEVEKELGFKNKKDIEIYGIDKFNKKAKESVWKYKNEWEQMTKKMGFWLDMSDPYITYENRYIESLWAIIKKIWDRKLLYLAHRVIPFCTRCGTGLSSHEVAQGYRTTTDRSVVVKFKILNLKFKNNQNSNNENWKLKIENSPVYILAWTTTPWTLPGNVALAVGASIKYQVVSIKGKDEKYILAEDLVGKVLNTEYEIHNTVFGSDLVGLEYEPLFEVEKLKSEKSYRIYDADFVSTTDGTGVVHTAVMYGEDDYDLGTKIGLPKFHTVDERGRFIKVSPELDEKYVKDPETEKLIIRELEIRNLLFKVEDFEHDYPFCWRCNTPLLYYAKESWFIKMSAVNKELLKNNQKINWIPEHIKEGRFGQWLKEGKDWAFSRERYWGTPLPVWKCTKCHEYRVIGSLDDLEKNRFNPQKNEYYVLRHGQSTKNGYGDMPPVISSRLENDKYHLTPEGKKQVREVARKIKKMGGIDIIISSPFIRTKETAHIVAEELGIKINVDDRIMEFQHGQICEGKTEHVCGIKFGKGDWEVKSADGESWKDLKKRMSSLLLNVDSKHEGKRILFVSHGDPIFLLENFTLGLAGDEAISMRDSIYPSEGELKKIHLRNWPYDDNGDLDLHRPYIDGITIKCFECGSEMKKVPDLIDVWFDSGAMPYAQWTSQSRNCPFVEFCPSWKRDRSLRLNGKTTSAAGRQFPADFIVEAIDQTRGWFFTLLAISTLLEKGAPYKNVMVLGHTLDEKGVKMSKSKGNFVPVMEFMDKYGVDVLRWYFLSSMTIGESKSVIPREIEDKQKGFFGTIGNCLRFYELYQNENPKSEIRNTKQIPNSKFKIQNISNFDIRASNLLDKWILSRFNGLVQNATGNLDKYEVTQTAKDIEKFIVEDLSNWWLRRSRKRKEALGLLRFLLLELSKIVAPFIPFTAEEMYLRLRSDLYSSRSDLESVHLHDWPKVNNKLINKELEKQMDEIRNIVTVGLAQRKEKQIKVRQPLRAIHLGLSNEFPKDLEGLLKEELNVKNIVYDKSPDFSKSKKDLSKIEDPRFANRDYREANRDQKKLVILDTEMDEALIFEGYARELMRQIQDMRKEAKYKVVDEIFSQWHSDNQDLSEAINKWSGEIKKEVLLKSFSAKGGSAYGGENSQVFDVEKEFELVTGKKIWVGVKK